MAKPKKVIDTTKNHYFIVYKGEEIITLLETSAHYPNVAEPKGWDFIELDSEKYMEIKNDMKYDWLVKNKKPIKGELKDEEKERQARRKARGKP